MLLGFAPTHRLFNGCALKHLTGGFCSLGRTGKSGKFRKKWVSLTGYPQNHWFSSSPFSPLTCYSWGYIAVYPVFRHPRRSIVKLWKWSESFVKYGAVSNGWISDPASFVYSFVFTWFWAIGVQATLKLFGGILKKQLEDNCAIRTDNVSDVSC